MRRPHRKTRTGCLQCRQRRIKCGEEKPTCAHCVRYALSCTYEEAKQRAAPKARTSPGAPAAATNHSPAPNPSCKGSLSLSNTVEQSLNAPSSHPPQPWFTLEDLELLHLYSTSTFRSFSANRDALWQTQVPAVAKAHPFVMHGLLATSALHLATLSPHRRDSLRKAAASHEMQALPAFREAVAHIDENNGTAIFAFGGFVVAYASAASSLVAEAEGQDYEDNLSDAVDEESAEQFLPPRWLLLLRSAFSFFAASAPLLRIGTILPGDTPSLNCSANPDDLRLASLLPLFDEVASPIQKPSSPSNPTAQQFPRHHPLPSPHVPLSADDATTFRTALDTLRLAMALPYSTPLNFHAAAYLWPGLVSGKFMEAVAQRRPQALVLFAHYCVLLRRGEVGPNSWYVRGQAERIVAAVVRSLRRLGEDWITWVEWPIACVFGDGERAKRTPSYPLDSHLMPEPWKRACGVQNNIDVSIAVGE